MSEADDPRAKAKVGKAGRHEAAGWSGRYVGRLGEEASGPKTLEGDGQPRSSSSLFPLDSATEPGQIEPVEELGEGHQNWGSMLAVFVVSLVLVAGLTFWLSGTSVWDRWGERDEASETEEDSVAGPQARTGRNLDGDLETAEATGTDGVATEEPTGAELQLELGRDLSFTAVGTVSDQGSADAIVAAVEANFGDQGRADITVDAELAQPQWLPSATRAVGLMPLLVYGSVDISQEQTLVTGRGLAADFDLLADGLAPDLGFPPLVMQADVVDERDPWVRAMAKDGLLTLTGQVPDERLAAALHSGAARSYSDELVRDLIELDDRTLPRSGLLLFGQHLGQLSVFDDYVLGLEENRLYGRFERGLTFEVSEAGLTNQNRRRLNALLPMLVRTATPVLIIGHVDTVEASEGRSELGRSRGQAIADYLIEGGVEGELVAIEDRGDTDPVASNSSGEGRAANRRVEIVIGGGG